MVFPIALSHSHVRMFAGDTHKTYSNNNISDINLYFDEDLLDVSEWLSPNNRLTLNQTKKGFMLIGSRNKISSEPALALNNIPVKRVTHSLILNLLVCILSAPVLECPHRFNYGIF